MRPRLVALTLAFIAACGSERDRAASEEEKLRKAALELARQQKERGKREAGIMAERVVSGINSTEGQLATALATGRRLKAEVDKVYQSDTDYDLAVSEEPSPDDDAHAERLAAMPTVTIGDVTVGYEEDTERSLRGVRYAKHFRATWRRDGELVRVSYYAHQQVDAVAFVALLEKLVPVVERELR